MTTSRTGEAPVVAGRGGHVAGRSSRGWRAVAIAGVAGAVLGAGAGALAATARPVHYRATVQEYIRFTEDSGAPDPSGPQKVRSYAGMVRSQRVLEPVITAQRLKTTVDELAGKVTAANPEGSLLVEISVTDASASTARTLAEAIGKQFASTVSQLEGRIVVTGTDQGSGQDSAQGSGQGSGQDGLPVSTATAVQVTAVGRSRLVRLEGPAWPWLAGGTLLGLAIGALGRAALRRRDPWIDEPTDLVPVTGAAPLGIVDDPRGGRRGAGAAVSAARSIAANLRFSDVDHPPRCLVIAGAYPDGAQTMVAADLAIGLARTGQKVVLVEADLAAFRLRTELRIDGRTGLTSILTGDSELDQVLVEWRDGVQVLPGGPLPPNPAQVMRSEQLASLLRVLKVRFDYVVLDGPPMLATPVAAELAARADGAVLVVTRGELRAGEVREALTALEQADARLLGTIFCDAPLRDGLRRGGLSRRTADPEAAPAEGRGYEPRGFETRSGDAPAPRRSGRSGSRSGSRSLEEFDDPSIVPLLLASPEELGREVESLPRHDLPSPYPGPAAAQAQSPLTPRRVPLVQVPGPRADADQDGAGGPPETVTLPPDDSYFGDLYEDTLPDDPFPQGRGPAGGSASRGGGPAWGTPAGGHQGQAAGPPGQGGHPGTAAQGGQPRYTATDQQPNRREDRPAAARTEQAPRQATLTEDPFPQVIPGPANPPSAGVVAAPPVLSAPPAPPTVVPSVVPSVGVAPTPAQTPPGGLSPSNRTSPAAVPAPVPVTPVLPRPSLAPQPGALAPSTGHAPAGSGAATPAPTTQPPATQLPAIQVQGGQAVVGHGTVGLTHSGHVPTVQPPAPQALAPQALAPQTLAPQAPAAQAPAVQAPAGYPGAPQGYPTPAPTHAPTPAPQLPSWAELRREYEEPRPAYLNDPDLDRPYQPLRGPETVTEQPPALPRRAATERHRHQESYPEPYAMPQQRAAEPAHRPAPEQRSYQEHSYGEQPSGERQYEDRPYDQYARQDDRRYGDQPAPSPYAEPAYQQPAPAVYQEPAYQEPTYREQKYPQVEYGREHVSEYGRGPEPVAGYPYPEAELPLPRRTVPPSMARPGMTVLPSQPPSGGSAGSGRRRARDAEPEPFLEASARELTWEEQQGQRGDDGQYRPY